MQPSRRERVAVHALVQDVVGNMRLVAEAKAIDLALLGADAATLTLDATQLRRVLYNLLDNAIKYTARGGRVTVRLGSKKNTVCLEIADSGAGIPAADVPRVFDRFYRGEARRTDSNGAGLGLAICQSLVKSMGGTIDLTSRQGVGTTVTVTLLE